MVPYDGSHGDLGELRTAVFQRGNVPAPEGAAVAHPLVDFVGDGFVVSDVSSPVVGLTEGRLGLLADAAKASTRVLLVTPHDSRLTFALAQYLQLFDARWAVRGADGSLALASTGAALRDFSAAFASDAPGERTHAPHSGAVRWVQLTITAHHGARKETMLGRAAELFCEELCGESLDGWGTHEPAGIHWNRQNITRFVRQRMPQETRLFFTGGTRHAISGTMHVFRSSLGVTEETKLVIALGADASEADAALARVTATLAQIAQSQQILFAMAYERSGTTDTTIAVGTDAMSAAGHAAEISPLAAVIGGRAIRSLRIDVEQMQSSFDAVRVGPHRTPSLVVPFGSVPLAAWERLAALLDTVGTEEVRLALGLPAAASVEQRNPDAS